MNPAELDMKKLKGLSKNDLATLVLKLGGEVAKMEREVERQKCEIERNKSEIEGNKREIERYRALQAEIVAVLRQIADNAEQMKLEAKEYYLTSEDPYAKDVDAQIARMVAVQITTLHRLSGLLYGMKPGSEKSTAKKKPQSDPSPQTEPAEDEEDSLKAKTRRPNTPVEHMKTLLSSLSVVDMNTPVGAVLDMAQKVIAENQLPVNEDNVDNNKKKKKGRCRNIDELPVEEYQFKDLPDEKECPHCGATAFKKSVLEWFLKTQPTVMKADEGIASPIRTDNYWCPHCKAYHTVSQGSDYPISSTRTMGLKPIVQSFYLHYLGMALNRAGASFENGALLGSDTLNRNAYEWGLIYIMPLYEALLNKMKEQRVIAADETCYDVTQPMGYGKKPKDQKDGATCAQTYVLSLGTVFRSDVQLHAYALLEGRGAEAISKFLNATFKLVALVTDAYPAYDKVLENHPNCDHQICLIHFRRYLMRGGSNAQAARDFMVLTPAQQAIVMERFKKENSVFYKEARIYQAISLIYQWEKEIVKARGDPNKLSEIRKKQTALMDLIDKLMDELCEGRVKQLKKDGPWSAVSSTDPLAKACTFYRNHRDKLRCFLKEDNYEIPPDSSVIEQNIRPIALIRNNSHFFTNADYAKVALAVFSIFRTLEKNHIDPLEWMDKYCRELFEHITARGLDRLYLDTVDFSKTRITVRQEPKLGEKAGPYCLSSYAADFDSKINDIIETGINNRKKLAEAQAQ